MGGGIGGAVSYFKGQNVWTGADIAAGRSQFSFKNTPVAGGVKVPKVTLEPDAMPNASQPSKPMASVAPSNPIATPGNATAPYTKGQVGVKQAMADFVKEGGTVLKEEVTIELNGVRNRFDFVGVKNDIPYLFEIKNGPNAGLTPNQKINLSQLMQNKSTFTPVGKNALKVPMFKVGQPYSGPYIVVFKHYF